MAVPIGGSIQPGGTATRFSTETTPVSVITIHARFANTENVYIGPSGVTAANGFEMTPDSAITMGLEEFGPIPLNRFFGIADNANDNIDFFGAGLE